MLVTSGPMVSVSVKGSLARVGEQERGGGLDAEITVGISVNPDFRQLGSS